MRACINCENRQQWDAGSRCRVDGHYIGYVATWDECCKKWQANNRKPGEIEVYMEPPKEDDANA